MKNSKKIIEGTMLIGNFMYPNIQELESGFPLDGSNYIAKIGVFLKEYSNMKYHTNWDWLIPVVEKIANTELINGDTKNLRYLCITYLSTFDKIVVFNSVVKFIKWYNKNNKYE